MPVYTKDSKVLLGPDGKVATDPACCCGGCCATDKNFTSPNSITFSINVNGSSTYLGDPCQTFNLSASRTLTRVDQDLSSPTPAGSGEFKRWCKDGAYFSSFYKAGFGPIDGFADIVSPTCTGD